MKALRLQLLRVVEELARVRTLVAAVTIAVVAYTVAEAVKDGTAGTFDAETTLFFKSIAAILVIWLTACLRMYWVYYSALEFFEYRDRSAAPKTPPTKGVQQGRDLTKAGFRPFGELEFRFPWQRWKHAWVLVDRDGYVFSLIGIQAAPTLWTGWTDGSFVITMTGFPASVRRTQSSSVLAVTPGTPAEDRYRRHLAEAVTFGAGRAPVRLASMAEFIAANTAAVVPTREALRAPFRVRAIALYAFAYLLSAWTLFS